jgi:hypothetical protein
LPSIALVEVRLNSGHWQPATGTTKWTASLNLIAGENQIEARSRDGAGHESPIVSVSVNYNPPDTTPPAPNPSTWMTKPTATGTTSVHMAAATGNDPSGVEYLFECVVGGGHSSGWQDSPTYGDAGLQPNTTYSYRLKMRDKSPNQNTGDFSTTESVSTAGDPADGGNASDTSTGDTGGSGGIPPGANGDSSRSDTGGAETQTTPQGCGAGAPGCGPVGVLQFAAISGCLRLMKRRRV